MPVIPVFAPGAPAAELECQRYNTAWFIDGRPYPLVLIPRAVIKTGSGIRFQDLPPRPLQRARLIELDHGNLRAEDGSQRSVQYQLLLPWDGQVGLYDYWVDGGIRHEVKEILPNNGYEVRAEVTCYGQTGQ